MLERSSRLLTRQLDARGIQLLRTYLEDLGLEIVTDAETAERRADNEGDLVCGSRFLVSVSC